MQMVHETKSIYLNSSFSHAQAQLLTVLPWLTIMHIQSILVRRHGSSWVPQDKLCWHINDRSSIKLQDLFAFRKSNQRTDLSLLQNSVFCSFSNIIIIRNRNRFPNFILDEHSPRRSNLWQWHHQRKSKENSNFD
jgi:hypothetical protein